MKKNLLKVVSTVALASTLVACGKTEKMTDAEKAQIKEDMAVQEAVTFLAENAVEK